MQWFGGIGDRKVILACEDAFLCRYLSSGLGQLGMSVVASACSIEEVLALAEAETVLPVAGISVNLPDLSPSLIAKLVEHRIPYLLFGVPWTPAAWSAALLWPFSAYQLARDLEEVLRQTVLSSAVPPWSDDAASE